MKFNTAILLSVVVHLGMVALLIANFQFSKVEIKATGETQPSINAKAVNSQRVEKLVEKLKQEKVRAQQKEQDRLDKIKNLETEAARKLKDEERKTQDAIEKRKIIEEQSKVEEQKTQALKKKRVEEEIERKKQVETEQKRVADVEKQRKAEAERKQKEEAEIKRKTKEEAEKKQKARAEKARQEALEKEMQAQMDAESAELKAAHQQQVNSEANKYVELIKGKIYRNWLISPPGYCIFKVKLSPGGLVLSVTQVEGDSQHCSSGERAIYKSEPLPMSNDPDVFQVLKDIRLTLDNRNK